MALEIPPHAAQVEFQTSFCIISVEVLLLRSAQKYCLRHISGGGITQWDKRLATNWSVRGSNSPIHVADRSRARVCGYSLPEVEGLNPAGVMDISVVEG